MSQPFNLLDHLDYVRVRALRALLAYGLASIAGFFLTPWAMSYFVGEGTPLRGLVFLSPAEAFFARVKMALALGLLIGFPFILYQLWALAAPAFNEKQKRFSLLLLPGAYILFVVGIVFAVVGVLPPALQFFLSFGGEELQQEISVGNYISFVIAFALPFGIIFQMPIIVVFLAQAGIVKARWLRKNRKYSIFAIFVIAAVLTPADAFSQMLMALPMMALYELSALLAGVVAPKGPRRQAEGFGEERK